jgi:hypothetical protein
MAITAREAAGRASTRIALESPISIDPYSLYH